MRVMDSNRKGDGLMGGGGGRGDSHSDATKSNVDGDEVIGFCKLATCAMEWYLFINSFVYLFIYFLVLSFLYLFIYLIFFLFIYLFIYLCIIRSLFLRYLRHLNFTFLSIIAKKKKKLTGVV